MKKILFIALFALILLGCSFGQDVDMIYIQDTGTVGWLDDKILDGIPYPDDAVIEYEIVLCEKGLDLEVSANYDYLGTALIEEYTYDISSFSWREYRVGIRAIVNGSPGDYAWSNDAEVCENGVTFSLCPQGLVPDKIKSMGMK